VAQIASDGRSAFAPDRAAHSSLSWGNTQGPAAMYGMTNKLKDYLVDLAKSWNRPPELNIHSKGFMSNGYDYTQRAYLIESDSKSTDLSFDLIANDNSPILNPAFVIVNWPGKEANLQINGKKIPEGTNFRQGLEYGIDGSKTLILWMKRTANKTINITLSNRVTE